MKTGCLVSLIVAGIIILISLIVGSSVVSTWKRVGSLETAVLAKQKANTANFDNMWKKITQVAQVPDEMMGKLKEIFVQNSQARTPENAGQLALWIKEAVPHVDTSMYNTLMNIITSARDEWTMRQLELVDMNRERDTIINNTVYGKILSGFFGWKSIDIVIITSSKTEKAFQTGKDDDLDLFKKNDSSQLEK